MLNREIPYIAVSLSYMYCNTTIFIYNRTPRYRRRSLGWGFFWLSIFGVAVTLAVVFSLRYGIADDNSSSNDFAPNETRAISYSSVFCESISITAYLTGFDPLTTATFNVLSQLPTLSDHDSFTFSENPQFIGVEYHNWNFYLYPGSILSVSACKQNSLSTFTYYLIKGKNHFNSWTDHPKSSLAIHTYPISTVCSSGTKQHFPLYDVSTEGEYYMVFYLSSYSGGVDALQIDFEVNRTKYAPEPDTVLSNCSLSDISQLCTLGVPLDYSIGLLTLTTTEAIEPIDWSSSISVDVDCNARVWVYILISLGCVIVIVLIVVFVVACCCFYLRRKKSTYTSLSGGNQATPVVTETPAPTTTTYVTGNEGPPPYNPSYGSTAPPPPKYS